MSDQHEVIVKDAGSVSLSQKLGIAKQEIEAIAALGFQLYEQGKVNDAEIIFNGLVALDSQVYYGYAGLGAMTLASEKLDDSVRWLTRAMELNPSDPTVHANLGEALLRQAKFEEAATEFRTAMSLDSNKVDPGVNRARVILTGMQTVMTELQRSQVAATT